MASSAPRWLRVKAVEGMQRKSDLRSGREARSREEGEEKDGRWLELLTTSMVVSMQRERERWSWW